MQARGSDTPPQPFSPSSHVCPSLLSLLTAAHPIASAPKRVKAAVPRTAPERCVPSCHIQSHSRSDPRVVQPFRNGTASRDQLACRDGRTVCPKPRGALQHGQLLSRPLQFLHPRRRGRMPLRSTRSHRCVPFARRRRPSPTRPVAGRRAARSADPRLSSAAPSAACHGAAVWASIDMERVEA